MQQAIDRQHYKTHFGPEETDEMLLDQLLCKEQQRRQLVNDLNEQVAQKATFKRSTYHLERQNDLFNLDVCKSTYLAEERAI